MTIESATYISDLNASNPGATDIIPEGDDHLRLIKTVLKNTITTDGSGNVSTTKNVTAAAVIPSSATIPTNGLYLKAANNPAIASNTTLRWDVSSAGVHSFAAPTAGTTVTITSLSGSASVLFQAPAASDAVAIWNLAGSVKQYQWYAKNSDSSFALRDNNAGADRLTVSTTGNLTGNAPSAGRTLALTAFSGAAGLSVVSAAAQAAYQAYSINGTDAAFAGTAGAAAQIVSDAATGDAFVRVETHDYRISTNAGTSSALVVTSDGRLYGKALHNNAGAVTGTTNQYVASGTYTPTLTNTTNIAASSFTNSPPAKWKRVGNEVIVSGHVTIQATAAAGAQCTLDLTLPIASNLANFEDCSGTASDAGGVGAANQNSSGLVQANVANDRAQIIFRANNTSSQIWGFTFMYTVL